jgi:uncharacterized protein
MNKINKEIILETITKNKSKIKKYGVEQLILFGSYAINKQTKQSDIDFLVKFKKNRGLFDDYIGLLHFLEDTFNKKIDLVKINLIREEIKKDILESVQYAKKI